MVCIGMFVSVLKEYLHFFDIYNHFFSIYSE